MLPYAQANLETKERVYVYTCEYLNSWRTHFIYPKSDISEFSKNGGSQYHKEDAEYHTTS